MDLFFEAACEEARKGLEEGGIPIGSVLVIEGQIIGRGHNQRIQKRSVVFKTIPQCGTKILASRIQFRSAEINVRCFEQSV